MVEVFYKYDLYLLCIFARAVTVGLTCVFHGEVRLALHSGGQVIHAQWLLSFEGRRLLTECREASEGALPVENLNWCVSAGYRLRSQHGHWKRRGRWGGRWTARLVDWRVCHTRCRVPSNLHFCLCCKRCATFRQQASAVVRNHKQIKACGICRFNQSCFLIISTSVIQCATLHPFTENGRCRGLRTS